MLDPVAFSFDTKRLVKFNLITKIKIKPTFVPMENWNWFRQNN